MRDITNSDSPAEDGLNQDTGLVPLSPRSGTLAGTKAILPAIITDAGEDAVTRFAEFFTVNIRNPHTRRAYFRNAIAFLRWCEGRGVRDLKAIKPMLVAAYVEQLQKTHSRPSVKQQLATIRMLFDWLVTGQVMAVNPAHSVRGPRHVVTQGKTPVLNAEETRTPSRQHPHRARDRHRGRWRGDQGAGSRRPARPGADRRHVLHLRPRRRGRRHDRRGLLPAGKALLAPAARERRQGARDARPIGVNLRIGCRGMKAYFFGDEPRCTFSRVG